MYKQTKKYKYKNLLRLLLCLMGMAGLILIFFFGSRKNPFVIGYFMAVTAVFGISLICHWLRENRRIKFLEMVFGKVFPFLPVELLEKNIRSSQDLWEGFLNRFVLLYEDTKTLESRRKSAEIASLSSQINPHFLYNTLESIRSEALFHNDNDAACMAEALGNFFRYNISRREDVVCVRDELENIRNYIHIQKYRFRERLSFEVIYNNDPELIHKAQIPKLSLQPLVENAVFHGIEKRVEGGCVTITLTASDQSLWIIVEDDGPGMDEADTKRLNQKIREGRIIHKASERQGGIALVNVHSRIQMIFGGQFGIIFSSVGGCGTQVEMTLPYRVGEP